VSHSSAAEPQLIDAWELNPEDPDGPAVPCKALVRRVTMVVVELNRRDGRLVLEPLDDAGRLVIREHAAVGNGLEVELLQPVSGETAREQIAQLTGKRVD
jgi:hypothetical protein